jgi:ADP-heptose:LPS heptosyltransferase
VAAARSGPFPTSETLDGVHARLFSSPSVYLSNGIGDQLLTLPAVRALDTLFPRGLQLLLREGLLSFFYRDLNVTDPVRVWWMDPDAGTIDFTRTLRTARASDLLVSFATRVSPSMATLPKAMGVRYSIGFSSAFDHSSPVVASRHMYDQTFALVQAIQPSLAFETFAGPPAFSSAAEAAAARLAARYRQPGGRLLVVHPETRPEKTWGTDRFASVLEHFLDAHPEYTAIVLETEPTPGWPTRPAVVPLDAHLELAMALMRHADLFLGVDSCFLHAADLFRVPGVALFGPTNPVHWGFRLAPRYRHITAASMDGITCEPVIEALMEVATP